LGFVSATLTPFKRLGLCVAAGLFATSCYTGPVNMRPTIEIDPPGVFSRGSSPTLRARAVDPEDGPLAIEWTTDAKRCPSPAEAQRPANWPQTGWVGALEYSVPSEKTSAAFCVWAKVSDRYGAEAVDTWDGLAQNHAPTARLKRTPSASSVPLRTPLAFSTEDSRDVDPGDDEKLETTAWRFEAAPVNPMDLVFVTCPVAGAAAPPDAGEVKADRSKRCFTPEVPGEYVISAAVTDGVDESIVMNTVIVQAGHVPVARVELKTPSKADVYPLGTTFHVSGAASSDDDENDVLIPKWNEEEFHAGAPASAAKLADCEGTLSPFERCFRADAPGIYKISLRVSDGANDSPPQTIELEVRGDEPPCLKLTSPAVGAMEAASLDPAEPIKWFKVLRVEDDLDPYPPDPAGDALHDRTTFRWSTNTGSGFKPAWGDFASFPLSVDGYRYGDEVQVRLEIFDRVTSATQLQACVTDVCRSSDMCVQRVTWKVQFIR
jgi:hypothetical protein